MKLPKWRRYDSSGWDRAKEFGGVASIWLARPFRATLIALMLSQDFDLGFHSAAFQAKYKIADATVLMQGTFIQTGLNLADSIPCRFTPPLAADLWRPKT
jgi:hypothetical protein